MRRLGLVAALIVALAGCSEATPAVTGSSIADPTTTVTEPADAATLPPHELADLAALFDPLVGPLGYQVTRAALIDRSTYEVRADAGHLAIYLAPITDISLDRFAADLVPITALFVPYVFETWPLLESFDVCQEPYASTEQTPPSLTIVDLSRDAAAQVDWSGLDLATLIDLGAEVEGLAVWARTGVRESATWQAAAGS